MTDHFLLQDLFALSDTSKDEYVLLSQTGKQMFSFLFTVKMRKFYKNNYIPTIQLFEFSCGSFQY